MPAHGARVEDIEDDRADHAVKRKALADGQNQLTYIEAVPGPK